MRGFIVQLGFDPFDYYYYIFFWTISLVISFIRIIRIGIIVLQKIKN